MKRARAFTLVELLVAMAVSMVLIAALLGLLSGTLSMWERGRGTMTSFSSARFLLERISDECTGVMVRAGGMEFAENLEADAFTAGATQPVGGISESLFAVTPYLNHQAGDLCVIAYRHNRGAATLERAFVPSADAWGAGGGGRYRSSGYAALEWRTVARGIIEFEIRAFTESEVNASAATPALAGWASENATRTEHYGKRPARIVVRLVMADDKTLSRLSGIAPGDPKYTEFVRRNAREFVSEVDLPPAT
jgi:hypothetical protein